MNNHSEQIRDAHVQRLLLYVNQWLDLHVYQVKRIKTNIFLLHTKEGKWILKQFPSVKRLCEQVNITSALQSHGFDQTYYFHPIHQTRYMNVDEKVYGLFRYIEHDQLFDYKTFENRASTLQLLTQFHEKSSTFYHQLSLESFHLYEKWVRRLHTFNKCLPTIQQSLPRAYIKQINLWSNEALIKMQRFSSDVKEKACIIHGDVASHNFITSTNGLLYMIDFDLAKKATPIIDYVQLAYRFLPEVDWSIEELRKHHQLDYYFQNPWFLATLLYPSDLLREWGRYASNLNVSREDWLYLDKLTFHDWEKRKQFIDAIMHMIHTTDW